jgi:hypothetical protein
MEGSVTPDEARVIEAFREIKRKEHGELEVAVKNGRLVKLWTTDKWDLNKPLKLREVPNGR